MGEASETVGGAGHAREAIDVVMVEVVVGELSETVGGAGQAQEAIDVVLVKGDVSSALALSVSPCPALSVSPVLALSDSSGRSNVNVVVVVFRARDRELLHR